VGSRGLLFCCIRGDVTPMKKVEIGGKVFLANVYVNPPLDGDDEPEERTRISGGGHIPDDDAYFNEREVSIDDICNAVGPHGRHLLR